MSQFETHITALYDGFLQLTTRPEIVVTAPADMIAYLRPYPDGPILASVAVLGTGVPTAYVFNFLADTVPNTTYWYDVWERGTAVFDIRYKTGGWVVTPPPGALDVGPVFNSCGDVIGGTEDRVPYKSGPGYGQSYTVPTTKRAGANGP